MWHGFCYKFLREYNSERILNIYQSYERMYSGTVFFDSLCISVLGFLISHEIFTETFHSLFP